MASCRTFGLCETTSLEDESARVMFAGDGVVTLPIQENDPACVGTLCNIKAVCGIMTDDGQGPPATGTMVPRGAGFVPWGIKEARLLYRAAAPSTQVERLAAIRKAQRSSSSHVDNDQDNTDPPCEVFPPTDSGGQRRRNGAVEGARSGLRQSWALDTPDPSNPDRAWLYQTCTEFGFYQARLFVAYRPALPPRPAFFPSPPCRLSSCQSFVFVALRRTGRGKKWE